MNLDVAVTLASIVVSPLVGSFLAVIAMRLPVGRTFVAGRSHCENCGKVLGPAELIPLISFAVQRGRCRTCGGPIDPLHPVLEAGALAAALWAALLTTGWILLASCVLGWTLLTLSAIDWRTGLLPDVLTLPLALAGLVVTYFVAPDELAAHAIGGAAGFLGFWAVAEVYRRLRGRDGLGLGDAKLLAVSGAWLGWFALPSVILFAAVFALLLALTQRFRGETVEATTRVAFGPALAAGTWIVWLYGPLVAG